MPGFPNFLTRFEKNILARKQWVVVVAAAAAVGCGGVWLCVLVCVCVCELCSIYSIFRFFSNFILFSMPDINIVQKK